MAQHSEIDTISVQRMVDSCGSIEDNATTLTCREDILLFINQSLKIVKDKKEKMFLDKSAINTLRGIGNIYKDNMLNYPKAMEYYQRSLKRAEEIRFKYGIGGAIFNLGNIYFQLNDYKKSLEYYQQGLVVFEGIALDKGVGMCLNGIGNSYSYLSQLDKALIYFQKSLKIQEARHDTAEISTCLLNIANAYFDLKDFRNTMDYYQKSLSLFQKIEDADGQLKSLHGIGEVLMKTGKSHDALHYFEKELTLAKTVKNLGSEGNARLLLRKFYEKLGNYKEALAMNDSAAIVFDSLANLQKRDEINRMDMQFDFDKKETLTKAQYEKQIAVAEEVRKKQRVLILSVICGLLFVIIFSVFIFNRWRLTQKQKKIIEDQKAEVELQRELAESQKRIAEEQTIIIKQQKAEVERVKNALIAEYQMTALRSQMNPHFIFNAINSIQNYILKEDSRHAYDYLVKFSKLIRMVLTNSNNNMLSLDQELATLSLYVEMEQLRFENAFDFSIKMDEKMDASNFLIPGMLLQPFIENSIWHGIMPLNNVRKGEIIIKITMQNSHLKIIIEDNGIGREKSKQIKKSATHKSVGILLSKNRLEILNKGESKQDHRMEVEDMYDENNLSTGTRITISTLISQIDEN